MKRGFDRTQRVADVIQKALAQMLLEMNDARFRLVTVTSVTMSRDLSYAKVYVSVLVDEPDKIKSIIDDLNQETKALRFQLAKAVKLRIVPELKFVYDESTAYGFKIRNLLNKG